MNPKHKYYELITPTKKKGVYPYRRWCKARTSKECQLIFKSDNKRKRVCDNCSKKLYEHRITVKRYMKMSGQEDYEETAKWKDDDNCILTFTEKKYLKNEKGELLGTSTQTINAEAKREDMEYNLKFRSEELKKTEKQASDIMKKIDSMGKKPFLTPEDVRVKKSIHKIHEVDEYDKMMEQLKNLDERIKEERVFVQMRTKTLKEAPNKSEV
jgi:hypothetical protein